MSVPLRIELIPLRILIYNINLLGHKKVHVAYGSWSYTTRFWDWRPTVFPKSCCHHDFKLFRWTAVIMYIIEDGGKHEVRMARTNLGLLFTHLVKKAWKNLSVKSKIVRKSSLKLTFSLDDCRKADFARPNSEPYCLEYLPS